MIAITGASGQLGRLVIDNLLSKTKAEDIVAIIRNPDKGKQFEDLGIEVRIADYNQVETLEPAFRGIDKLLLISGSEVGQRVPQHTAVINAAKAQNVKLFAYTSMLKTNSSPLLLAEEHKVTEAAIKESGLPSVILRNGWYTENFIQNINTEIEMEKVFGASKQGEWYTAERKDYAEAAAAVLISDENQAGKVYELAGDTGFTLEEYADSIEKQVNKKITYQNLSSQDYSNLLVQAGLPQGFADVLADAQSNAASNWLAESSGTLKKIIGRPTTPLAESIAAAV